MKTSKILTALVLPAMLAACTAEDIETGVNNVAQSERPLLSKDFKLISEGEGEGVDSRFYMAGTSTLKTVYENGDKYGAALIDQYYPNGTTITSGNESVIVRGPEQWPIIESLAGNIPFIYDATAEEWTAVAATGVGHYLFSFPYNINDQNRAAVSWELPAIQELYTDEDGAADLNAAINKHNKSVAAALLKENATSHSVTMRNLFSYPKFIIKFDNGMPVTTVSQVVLEYTEDNKNFATKGGFDHKKVWNMFNPETIADKIDDETYDNVDEYWAAQQTADFVLAYGNSFAKHDESQYIVAKFPNDHKVVLDSDDNKCVEVRFMIPGAIYNYTMGTGYAVEKNFTMHVYTNNGVYTIKDVANSIIFKSTTPEDVRERVFARNASYTLTLENITSATKPTEKLNIVTDVEDWNALVDKYGASKAYKGADKALQVAVVGDGFTLDTTAEMPTVANFKITTDVTIEGEVTLNNVISSTTGKKVIVAEGATLNIADNSNTISLVENHGTLNFKKAIASRAEVVEEIDGIIEVNNMPNATINIEEDAEVDFELNNKIAKALANGNPDDLTHGTLINNGILALDGENSGEIVNNNIIVFEDDFENKAKYATVTLDEEGEPVATFMPVITNNGEITVKDVVANAGKFINAEDATIACAKSGEFNNSGYAKVEDGSTFLISTNTGTIELEKYNQTKWEIESGNAATILFYATEDSYDFSESEVTKVITSVDELEIEATGKLAELVMNADATLTLPEYDAEDEDDDENGVNDTEFRGTLTVNADVVIESELAKMNKLIVSEDGSVTINKDNVVYAVAVENAGAVLVAGEFNTDVETEDSAVVGEGIFKSTKGTSNNINFNVQGKIDADEDAAETLAAKKEAYEKALVEAIEAWVTDVDNNDVVKVSAAGYDLSAVDEDDKNIAAGIFTTYYSSASVNSSWTKYAEFSALKTAFEAYKTLQSDATLTSSWSTAVETVLTHFAQGGCEDADEDGKIDLVTGWVYDLSKLSWTPETLVYLDDAADVEEPKTAEEKALADLKAAVIAKTVKNNGADLSAIQKVLLNTNTTTGNVAETIPAQSVVFAEDDIYKIFGNTAIGLVNDWSDYLTGSYAATVGYASNWSLDMLNDWIDAVSAGVQNPDLKVEMAREYVKENSIITKRQTWKYSDELIQAIVVSYGRTTEVVEVDASTIGAALALGKSVKLTENVEITDPLAVNGNLTIDLNGFDITSSVNAIVVNGGAVTIDGEGSVTGGSGGDYVAVRANEGSIVTIKNGTYSVGEDASNKGNSTIYAYGGKVVIEGGTFSSEAMYSDRYWVLNVEQVNTGSNNGEILVTGGTFLKFNPACPNTDDYDSYISVADGYKVKCILSDGTVGDPDITVAWSKALETQYGELKYEVYK